VRQDDDSYVEFISARWSSLYRTAYLLSDGIVGADDLLQSALLKAYVKWNRIAKMAAPEAYVRTILVNTLISEKRRRSSSEYPTGDVLAASDSGHDDAIVDRSSLLEQVRKLPERQRAVVVLRYYEDMSERQISEALGCSVGTVKSQAFHALRSLRRELDAYDQPQPSSGEST